MALTDINRDDRLVQQTIAAHRETAPARDPPSIAEAGALFDLAGK